MRSKFLFLVGLAAGYVLGARAGRERYEQLRSLARGFWEDPRVRKARSEAEAYARQQAPVIRAKAESVAKAAPGAIADGAKATAGAAKAVADRATSVATNVADRATTVTKDVAERVSETADELRDRVASTASELRDRGEEAFDRAVVSASEARDDALAEIDDEDDIR